MTTISFFVRAVQGTANWSEPSLIVTNILSIRLFYSNSTKVYMMYIKKGCRRLKFFLSTTECECYDYIGLDTN